MIKQFTFKDIENQNRITAIFPLVVVVAVVIIAIAGVYAVNRHSPSKSNQAANNTKKSSVEANIVIGPATSAQNDVLTMKEYGIAVPLTPDLHGLSYVAESNLQKTLVVVNLKINSYTALANKCLGFSAGTSQSIASIVKTIGKYDPAQNPNVRNLKQFDNFYIADIGGSQPAKVTCKDPSVQPQYDSLYAQLNSALDSSFANAKLST